MRLAARLMTATLVAALCACASRRVEVTPTYVASIGGPITFRGTVQDIEGYTRLQNATVELAMVGDANKPFAVAATDEQGEFAFSGLTPGPYMLRIGRPGYNETRMRVDAGPDVKPIDIRLRSLRTRCLQSRYHTDCP